MKRVLILLLMAGLWLPLAADVELCDVNGYCHRLVGEYACGDWPLSEDATCNDFGPVLVTRLSTYEHAAGSLSIEYDPAGLVQIRRRDTNGDVIGEVLTVMDISDLVESGPLGVGAEVVEGKMSLAIAEESFNGPQTILNVDIIRVDAEALTIIERLTRSVDISSIVTPILPPAGVQLVYSWISNQEGQFQSVIIANNHSDVEASVSLTGRRNGGDMETVSRTIPARGFLREAAADMFPGLGSGVGYTVTLTCEDTDKITGAWVTNNLLAASGGSPSQGVAIRLPRNSSELGDNTGSNLMFNYLPGTGDFISAPVIVNLGEESARIELYFYDTEGNFLREHTFHWSDPLTPRVLLARDIVPPGSGDVYMVARSNQLITGVVFVFNSVFGEPAIGNATSIDFTISR